MAIFNSYVKLPEGRSGIVNSNHAIFPDLTDTGIFPGLLQRNSTNSWPFNVVTGWVKSRGFSEVTKWMLWIVKSHEINVLPFGYD